MEKLAVLGGPYTYSDLAAPSGYEKIYFPTIAEVFDAVSGGRADLAIVPIENLLAGPVSESLQCLSKYDVQIVREIEFPIDHCLVRRKGEAGEKVSAIYSHKQALAQCRKYLDENFPSARRTECPSTVSALSALAKGEKGAAAIGSRKAALALGLDIEKEGIADRGINRTLFVLIRSSLSRTS